MKLHDLRPAEGSRRPRTRVGRGIAAGKGKTAGRGTKGQRSRAGASIPPWFEGGQTPLSMRIPKLRGFKNRFKVEYEVVNVGRIAALVAAGRLEPGDMPGAKTTKPAKGASAPITVNQEILRATGLVSTLNKPLKVLGSGEVDVPLFVVADAVSASARTKIEAAGGTVQLLEIPKTPLAALGVEEQAPDADASADESRATAAPGKRGKAAKGHDHDEAAETDEPAQAKGSAEVAEGAAADETTGVAEKSEAVEPEATPAATVKPRRARASKATTADAAPADAEPAEGAPVDAPAPDSVEAAVTAADATDATEPADEAAPPDDAEPGA